MRNAQGSERAPAGLFVGLATLDVVHRVASRPDVNEKVTATAQFVSAGGPAANAAVVHAALGGTATLVTALGDAPVADLVRSDLAAHGVTVVDVAVGTERAVPVSAIAVVEGTGDRSVVSLDAVTSDAGPPPSLERLVAAADVVLVDGHHPDLAGAAARCAAARGVPLVVDAGRWKPVLGAIAEHATDMVCSADFRVPGADTSEAMAAALLARGVGTVVVTHGGGPVQWWAGGRSGEVAVPAVTAVDTLGAGDAFHGAYCFHAGDALVDRIERSARVAALRVSTVGPRAWLAELRGGGETR